MKYHRFGTLDWEASALGFGVMQLPWIDEDAANINEAESIKMIRYAIDHGVNYLDLGYPYDMRQHERLARLVSRALRDGYRDRIKIAATLPTFLIDSSLDFDRCLNEQLQWLEIDRLDFCLLGRLNRENWPRLKELDVLSRVEEAMAHGRIDKLGFSFHDHFQILKKILTDYDNWTLGQFQYSYMDTEHDPGISGLKYAAGKGLAVVVTEPLRGGRLTKEPPESLAYIWTSAPQKRTLAEWGLRWVWNHPEVSVVVSEVSTMEQLEENIALAGSVEADSLTVQELVLFGRVREAYRKLRPVPCPSCRACMPCPQGIDVPRLFELYNDAVIYEDVETARSIYFGEQHRVENCSECGICENACAKRIPVLEWLKKVQQLFA